MLSLFPELLDWSWYVPLAFRLFLGAYLLYAGWTFAQQEGRAVEKDDHASWVLLGVLLALFGLLFAIGLYVQALGGTGFVLAMFAFFLRWKHSSHTQESPAFYLLIGIVSLSLVFLGPGPYAFDLPL